MDWAQLAYMAFLAVSSAFAGYGLGLWHGKEAGRKLIRKTYAVAWKDGWKMRGLVAASGLPEAVGDDLLAAIMREGDAERGGA